MEDEIDFMDCLGDVLNGTELDSRHLWWFTLNSGVRKFGRVVGYKMTPTGTPVTIKIETPDTKERFIEIPWGSINYIQHHRRVYGSIEGSRTEH